jgi:TRAP-type C4-dicarboxylate transport system permease small subunit
MKRALVAAIDRISLLFALISAALLTAAMLVVCEMIFMRYVFRSPTIWQTDFVVFAATASIFLGAPYVLMRKGHVGVDVVERIVPPRLNRGLALIGDVLGLVFCLAMAVASAVHIAEAIAGRWETSGVWQIPYWIPVLPLPVGFSLLSLQYIAEFLREPQP